MLAIVVLHPTKGREHGSLLQIFFIVGFTDFLDNLGKD
jgi:hypothetical protein